MPETAGGRSAGQGELWLPRRTGKPWPADWSHHQAHGRDIPRPVAGEAVRSRRLSRRRAGRHSTPGGQRVHSRRFHPRPGHRGDEPARHHVLGARPYLRAHRRLRQRAPRPPLLFRSNQARSLAATEACHRDLAATGADLSAYNSSESAADFADLRKVLGYAAWNVYGTSYGSYLAQTLMRDHPEGIRSVVLDVRDPATGEDIEVVIDGGAIVDWLRNQNYAVPLLRAVPDPIDAPDRVIRP